jgi:hypothetical protein
MLSVRTADEAGARGSREELQLATVRHSDASTPTANWEIKRMQ